MYMFEEEGLEDALVGVHFGKAIAHSFQKYMTPHGLPTLLEGPETSI